MSPFVPKSSKSREILELVQCNKLHEAERRCTELGSEGRLDPELWFTVGERFCRQKMFAEAERCINRLLEAIPGHAAAWTQLGIVFELSGRIDEARGCFTKAVRLEPESPGLYKKLGDLLKAQGLEHRAAGVLTEGLVQQAKSLYKNGFLGEAIEAASQVLESDSDNLSAMVILANALRAQGRVYGAEKSYRRVLELEGSAIVHSDLLLCVNYIPGRSPGDVFQEHIRWGSLYGASDKAFKHYSNTRDPERPLRIGYISPDFRKGPVSCFFLPLVKSHDKSIVKTYCYDTGTRPEDSVTESLRSTADVWRNVAGLSHDGLCQYVRDDLIDILVDLSGHTPGNSLPVFVRKPAPVQVTYLGYVNTTAIPAIDYRLVDSITDPENTEQKYTEQLVRLGNGLVCYDAPDESADVVPPPVLKNNFITFGSVSSLMKINDRVTTMWARVLHAVPRSRMYIFRSRLLDRQARKIILARFAREGIYEDRITLVWEYPEGGYWGIYNQMDIMLDTFPWNAHTTACEALWMGVPIVTIRGRRHCGRLCASVLQQAGYPDLIASSADEFVMMASTLAGQPEVLADMRRQMRNRVRESRLCDAESFVRELESEYRKMWVTWCENGEHER